MPLEVDEMLHPVNLYVHPPMLYPVQLLTQVSVYRLLPLQGFLAYVQKHPDPPILVWELWIFIYNARMIG